VCSAVAAVTNQLWSRSWHRLWATGWKWFPDDALLSCLIAVCPISFWSRRVATQQQSILVQYLIIITVCVCLLQGDADVSINITPTYSTRHRHWWRVEGNKFQVDRYYERTDIVVCVCVDVAIVQARSTSSADSSYRKTAVSLLCHAISSSSCSLCKLLLLFDATSECRVCDDDYLLLPISWQTLHHQVCVLLYSTRKHYSRVVDVVNKLYNYCCCCCPLP
jgi:hypothetical protein